MHRPVLLVVVDTEEEFDWNAPFARSANTVAAIADLPRLQAVLREFSVVPAYVIDYPVASRAASVAVLRPWVEAGEALVGAHLHAWVNPPFEEPVTTFNSYQANLAAGLERRKLEVLTECIADAFGAPPQIHKAGRYGFGPATAASLLDLGYRIDMSPAAGVDYSGDGGPDYSHCGPTPRWIERPRLLSIPNTGAFIGPLAAWGPRVFAAATLATALGRLGSRILSRGRLLERIFLSPEGHTLDKLIRLTRVLHGRGERVFVLSLHSPTLRPGCTPYAATSAERDALLAKLRAFLEFFHVALDGVAMSPLELRHLLLATPPEMTSE